MNWFNVNENEIFVINNWVIYKLFNYIAIKLRNHNNINRINDIWSRIFN